MRQARHEALVLWLACGALANAAFALRIEVLRGEGANNNAAQNLETTAVIRVLDARGVGVPNALVVFTGPDSGATGKLIAWGPGPRASQALMLAVRARALLDGRLAPSIDDVIDLAEPVLKHRMALTFTARAEGESIEAVIGRLKARIG